VVFVVALATDASPVHIPGGFVVDSECMVEVANGEIFDETSQVKLPAHCNSLSVNRPRIQIYASDTHMHSVEPLTSFTADWVVPALPRQDYGQTVYFWPGFKSQQPEMGWPVLQPVLQFGQGCRGWGLQSWFVDANDGRFPVVTAPVVCVSPGDHITSYMSLSADGRTWTVSGTDLGTGRDSTLQISYSRAGNCEYDYAMLVNENIGVDNSCQLMPEAEELVFTNVTVNGKVASWTTRANCANNPSCDCRNSASVDDEDNVHLGWSASAVVSV